MSNIISSNDPDAGIRVAITPSQSAYFAGEPFSVTITFTNTRNAEAGPSKTPSYYGHKRGAHSISSAPLSRPPTSPGTPRLTPVQAPLIARAKSSNDAPIRRGLVGKSTDELALEQRRKKLQGKSLSVSISPADVDAELLSTPSASAGPHQRSFQDSATFHRSPLVPSTLPRTDALPLSRSHPHARKESVVDLPETPSIYPPITTPNSSTSSFSLDTIAEGARNPSYPTTPILGSPTIEPASPSRFSHSIYGHYPSSALSSHPRSRLGLGHPSSNHPYRHGLQPPHSASSSGSFPQIHQPNSEVILYSYAQLTGSVVITPSIPGAGAHVALSQEHVQNLKHVRASLRKKNVVGGGSMDINSSLLSRTPSQEGITISPTSVVERQMGMSMKGHGRSSSLTGALFSMLSPSALFSSSSESLESLQPPPSSGVPSSGRWRSSSNSSLRSASGWPVHEDEPDRPGTPPATSGLGLGLGLPTGNQNTIVTHSRSRRGSNASQTTSTHSRRSSVAGWILGVGEQTLGSASIAGRSNGPANASHSDPAAPLPTFEVQPAMLAVDLVLAPGESRSYTYTVNLPDNLPPTFRGKAIHFSYELVVGLCRSGQSDSLAADGLAEHGGANVSKLMKVPIRMYNNVVVEHPPKPYNLLWPVDKRMDLAMPSSQATVTENDLSRLSASARPRSTSKGKAKGKDGLEEFLRYTARLLDILPPPELQPEHSVGATPYQNELEVEPREGEDGHAESPTTPSPPRRETPAPEDDIPEPDSPPLDPITPTSSNTPSEMSLSPHPSRSASSSPPPPSSQTSAPPPSSPPEALQDLTKPTTRPAPRKPAMLDLSFESHRGRQSHECSVGSNRGSSAVRTHEEGDGGGGTLGSGCREAVEILTRTQKKASYDVTKDGVKVAILTFPKSSYRLGETISGVVEINERKGRARVVQLAAFLEAHESLPSSLFPPSANRYLKRTYTEHFSSHLLNTLRTTFSLDIPSDASPAFQTCVGTPKGGPNTPGGTTSFGGLEWKVRLCLLVAVAGENTNTGTEGVHFKALVRDGPRGEWGSGWRALPTSCPLEKPNPKRKPKPASLRLRSANSSQRSSIDSMTSPSASSAKSTSWTAFFASYLSPTMEREYHDGDEFGDEDHDDSSEGGGSRLFGGSISSALLEDHDDEEDEESLDEGYDGIKPDLAGGVGRGVDFGGGDEGWRNAKLEMVECEVPVRVWPGNTAFKAMDVVFEV